MDVIRSLDHFLKNSFEPAKRKKTAAMSKLKSLLVFIWLFLSSAVCHAQTDGDKVDMADTMRSNGRIFVVVAVVVVILIGLILYMIRLDRKISKMEKENR